MKLIEIQPKPKTLQELFETHPEVWCQDALYLNERDSECSRFSAEKCCLLGAIRFIHDYDPEKEIEIKRKIRTITGGGPVSLFNDEHTFEEVMKVIKEAQV